MLKLLLTTDWTKGRDTVLSMIAEDVRRGQGNRILMVPELISHDMERRLSAAAGDASSRYAEVLSFTRLARRVADSVGAAAMECMDNSGRVVAMAAAARQLHSKLKAYAAVETRPEFLTGLLDAVDEFKRCCIGAADLREASRHAEGVFAQKLEELSLILEAYDGLCARGKRDPRDQMTWLLEQLCDSDFARNHTFYIDGFPDLTRQHMAILEHLIRESPLVVVSMNCDRPDSVEPAFEKAGFTASQILRCAREAGVPVQTEYLPSREDPVGRICQALFGGDIPRDPQVQSAVTALRGESVHRECEGAAQRVLALVRGGCRYRDIGIVCADMAGFANSMDLVFNRCGIPLYRSGTEDILQRTVISTVLSAMDAALDGYERQDVLRYLKSSLSPLSQEQCDELENYSIIWAVSGKGWLRPWENHPDGLDGRWDDAAYARLQSLEENRKIAMEPLAHLSHAFREAENLAQQVKALYAFCEEISLAQRLELMAGELDAAGDNRSAQILGQLWEILLTAMEQLHDVLGATVWDAETFTRLFTLLLSQYDVGTIPPVLDAVTVGPASAMRCQETKHLLVLGAQEGAMPGYGGTSGILTDRERETLRAMGVPLTGGGMEGLQAEFAEIYGVFCGARETVTVSCGPSQPSFLYRRLAAMAGSELEIPPMPLGSDALTAAAYLASVGGEAEALALGLEGDYRRICGLRSYRLGKVSTQRIPALYGKKLRLSASQVDKQAECRLAYFLRYGLRAKERREATVDPAQFGTYVHYVLEHTAKEVMSMGGFRQVSLDDTMSIAMHHSEAYTKDRFSQLDSQRLRYLFQRNIVELSMVVEELWQELSASSFDPVAFEFAFGDDGAVAAIEIGGAAMPAQLRGYVDRVDTWSNGYTDYFRVVDYKTGKKDFDYCDVFNGIGLQMLLYLFALEEQHVDLLGENPACAGVQYFPARIPVLSAGGRLDTETAAAERGKALKRKGLVLADSDVLTAMEPEGAPKRLSCKTGKDGSLTGDIADREQLKLLKHYIYRVLRSLVNEIASGEVEPNPYTRGSSHSACTYCPYQAVCHPATVAGRRNYRSMTAQRFWEEIGREMYRNG